MWVKWCWKCCQTASWHIQVMWSFLLIVFLQLNLTLVPATHKSPCFYTTTYCSPAHKPASSPPSPPVGESLFVTCYVSKLTNLLLCLPPLQQVSHCLWHATFPSSLTCSSLFLPSSSWVLICDMPCFQAHQPAPPSSSPPGCKSSFVTCHISKLTNPLLSLLPSSSWVLICDVPYF